jgi:hypothetical protein
MKRAQPEFDLTCAIARYLEHAVPHNVPWTHFPAGEKRTAKTGARLKAMGLKPGWPDFQFLFNGQFIGIELKAGKGKQSESQKGVSSLILEHGGIYAVCTSLEGVQSVLRACDVPLKAYI